LEADEEDDLREARINFFLKVNEPAPPKRARVREYFWRAKMARWKAKKDKLDAPYDKLLKRVNANIAKKADDAKKAVVASAPAPVVGNGRRGRPKGSKNKI